MKKKIFLIVIFSFLIYFPSLFFSFSYFDDQILILENLNFIKNLANFFSIFRQDVFFINNSSAAYYRPLLTLSFMIDAQFSGASGFFYHLTNIIYHAISSILVFIFLKKLKINQSISFFLSLFFLAHPVLTQAISWIPGRNDSLLTIFTLSAFIFLINYLEKNQFFSLIGYFLFFALSLLTKETAILIPFFTILFLFLFYNEQKSHLPIYIFGWWIIILFWIILRQNALNNVLYLSFFDVIKAVVNNSPAIILYWGKIFFPFNFSVLPIIADSNFYWGIFAIIFFVFGIFLVGVVDRKKFLFGFLWFILFLVPNFIRPNTSINPDFLEHRVYLPLVGFLIILSSLKIVDISLISRTKQYFIFLLIFVLGLISFFHQFDFKDRLTFWKKAVLSSPHSPLAHRNYGVMLYFDGKLKEAEEEFRQALKLNPQEPMAHNNLGVIYMKQGKWRQAEREFKEELKVNSYYDNALYNLGLVYYNLGEKNKAKEFWHKTIEINSRYLSAYKSLGVLYQEIGDSSAAEKYLLIYQQLSQ